MPNVFDQHLHCALPASAQTRSTPRDPGHWDLDIPGLSDDDLRVKMREYALAFKVQEPF